MCNFEVEILQSNLNTNGSTQKILKIINEKKPQSVKQIIIILKKEMYSEEEILETVQKLQTEGKINLNKTKKHQNLAAYLSTKGAMW